MAVSTARRLAKGNVGGIDQSHRPGQEKIPNNWYRRPSDNQYSLQAIGGDLAINYLAYPESARIGGNTHGVDTYAGIDLGDLTGGAYNFTDLLSSKGGLGSGFACYFTEITQAAIPNFADLPLG